MRVAALYDIHGNLPALDAVLEQVRLAGVDQVVVGGDVIPGPMPRATIERLLNLDIPTRFIQGNGEREVLDPTGAVPEQYREAMSWNLAQLTPKYERTLRDWPKTLRLPIAGLGDVFFCHATPRSDAELFTRLTPEHRLLPLFDGVRERVILCGHTHMQFDRTVGTVRVINAGSVGMPFGEPGAYWVLLGSDVELRHTPYDLPKAGELIRHSGYPQAAHFAEHNVLHPPPEGEMLKLFSRSDPG